MRRYADKRDKAEQPIVNYLRRIGCSVQLLSQKGVPDLMVSDGPLDKFVILLEVKTGAGNLTNDQEIFFKRWGNSFCYIVRSVKETKEVLRLFMPVYIYKCADCGIIEKKQSFSDKPFETCPNCEKQPVTKVFTVPNIVFKGDGWAGKELNNGNT